jgi:putative transposase
VVFIPKCRRPRLYEQVRRYLGRCSAGRPSRKGDGSKPPRYAVAQVVGCINGKSAIHLARVYSERKRHVVGLYFWARGYFVPTVGRNEALIREYIRTQEQEDQRLDPLGLWR